MPVVFIQMFQDSVAAYLAGEWGRAHQLLYKPREILESQDAEADPATEALIDRIETVNSFCRKAVAHFRERVPKVVNEETADALEARLANDTWLPPHDWRGAWRIGND